MFVKCEESSSKTTTVRKEYEDNNNTGPPFQVLHEHLEREGKNVLFSAEVRAQRAKSKTQRVHFHTLPQNQNHSTVLISITIKTESEFNGRRIRSESDFNRHNQNTGAQTALFFTRLLSRKLRSSAAAIVSHTMKPTVFFTPCSRSSHAQLISQSLNSRSRPSCLICSPTGNSFVAMSAF